MKTLVIEAPAKINLFLDVKGKRNDGYHELESIMHQINLVDRINIQVDDGITVKSSSPYIPDDAGNLAYQAARIFRVPPHMLADLEKSSFSNIEQQSLEFVKYTLDPWVVRWEQSMCRALLMESEKPTVFIKFNVDGLLRGDYVSRMSGYATARQNGWMSANDIRELENLDRIPAEIGGDLYLINGAMTKLQDAGAFANTTGLEETE
jgi:hypothetical protein